MSKEEIAKSLKEAGRILILTHIDPDGDAIGSVLGLGLALERLGKKVTMACQDPVPKRFLHLPGSQRIIPYPCGSFDLVVSLDANDLRRLGRAYSPELFGHLPLVNIDHHVTNPFFGTLNWVDPQAAATAEMVLELLEGIPAPIDPDVATCLLNGIVTDTQGFRTPSTTPRTLEAALKLQKAGANLHRVMTYAFNHHPFKLLQLWSRLLGRVQFRDGIIWVDKPRALLDELELGEDSDSGLINFLLGVEGARVAVIFTEKPGGEVDVSFRSVPGIDVSAVAVKLGGGGHPQAAGCRLKGNLEEVKEIVLKELRRLPSDHEA